MKTKSVTNEQQELLTEFRCLIKAFLNEEEGTRQVSKYISSVAHDDSTLLIYLKGRKYSVNHAWETLKRHAEVRFNEYPEVFLKTIPEKTLTLLNIGIAGLLKARDIFGRRVIYFHAGKWDPSKISTVQMNAACIHFADKMLLDEDVMNNGIVLAQDCAGMGLKHFKEYSLHNMIRMINIFCYAYPVKFKGTYYFNVPVYTPYLYKIVKPFLPKKLKERFFFSTSDQKFEALHEILRPNQLPRSLGGVLDNDEAFELDIFHPIK